MVLLIAASSLLTDCGGSGTSVGPAPGQPAAGVTPSPSGGSQTAVPGATATPGSSPAPGASITPVPSHTATSAPAPGASATPASGASATPAPAMSATPGLTMGGPLCLPITPSTSLGAPQALRFGIDTGAAGNLVPVTTTTPVPVDSTKEFAALSGLQPAHGPLVIRLNRLFWNGGEALLQQFASQAQSYERAGYDVEVQVRYQPPTGDVDDITDWVAYVRHVVDVLGVSDHLVALTITNEVNFDVSPNTSDGVYPGADDALIQGIEAAADETQKNGWGRRIKMGFTFAYRLNPATDSDLFSYIGQTGGDAFRSALGFVGLDDYPGTVYPPAFPPGDTAASEMGEAIATMRDCYLPLAGIGFSTPLWITENGYGSSSMAYAKQTAALSGTIDEVRAVSGTYDVADYRWFNLRDNISTGTGTFDQDGLLNDDYSPKTSYAAFQQEIAKP